MIRVMSVRDRCDKDMSRNWCKDGVQETCAVTTGLYEKESLYM